MKLSELLRTVEALIKERGDGECACFLFTEREVEGIARDLGLKLDPAAVLEEFHNNDGDPMHEDYLIERLVDLCRLFEPPQ